MAGAAIAVLAITSLAPATYAGDRPSWGGGGYGNGYGGGGYGHHSGGKKGGYTPSYKKDCPTDRQVNNGAGEGGVMVNIHAEILCAPYPAPPHAWWVDQNDCLWLVFKDSRGRFIFYHGIRLNPDDVGNWPEDIEMPGDWAHEFDLIP